ncbi:hypothetical protein ERJ75_000006700 [Trypanosoma vivax]|nr:hypothetical protein ERJ75_000006700 [Trypanosoma vivax]
MEAERATLAQSLEGARASERALRLQLRGVLEELSSAEHAVRVVEHALCHVPASMQHRTSVGDNAAAVPLLPARIEQLADYVCKARGGVSARLEELLPWHFGTHVTTVRSHVCRSCGARRRQRRRNYARRLRLRRGSCVL